MDFRKLIQVEKRVFEIFADEADDPEDEGGDFSGFNEKVPDALKSPEEIRKIRTKKDIFSYAASVGLDLGENYEEKSLKELQETVINFQEEKLEEETRAATSAGSTNFLLFRNARSAPEMSAGRIVPGLYAFPPVTTVTFVLYLIMRQPPSLLKAMDVLNMKNVEIKPRVVDDALTFYGRIAELDLDLYTYDECKI